MDLVHLVEILVVVGRSDEVGWRDLHLASAFSFLLQDLSMFQLDINSFRKFNLCLIKSILEKTHKYSNKQINMPGIAE